MRENENQRRKEFQKGKRTNLTRMGHAAGGDNYGCAEVLLRQSRPDAKEN